MRHAIVSVLWGRQRGLKRAIAPGETLRVGRTERATLVIPDDAKLSGLHFELTWDGERCHLKDLGSALGTEVGGRRVDAGPVPHGGWVRAGETSFLVHVEGATPPPEPDVYDPDYEPDPPHLAARRAEALDALRAAERRGSLYAVLDAARDERILVLLRESIDEATSLYEGTGGEPLADVAPYLVRLERGSPLLDALVREGWGKRWGFYARCRSTTRALKRHLRRFLVVRNEETGGKMYFRYYDPAVLRVFLEAATPLMRSELFGEMEELLLEGPRASLVRLTAPVSREEER